MCNGIQGIEDRERFDELWQHVYSVGSRRGNQIETDIDAQETRIGEGRVAETMEAGVANSYHSHGRGNHLLHEIAVNMPTWSGNGGCFDEAIGGGVHMGVKLQSDNQFCLLVVGGWGAPPVAAPKGTRGLWSNAFRASSPLFPGAEMRLGLPLPIRRNAERPAPQRTPPLRTRAEQGAAKLQARWLTC
ncbi:hypothetical protein COCMIDRAFT_22515 [Bipolaris oryzae ATCC 44560]|uniref:Uncharacterized protein n=1 Tax=Bipolaris oryzae ATCC 44560 TaxID=930090 RepID=W6ZR26_COCMI|nr:uncharacterized protein COCMIDRAFT_22515 [Bipolaris oryzae ATCC 44560]EUC49959.1 hypothetical protein COCMIDRAFT_22515 [Bipolaris oryzae ATCC 44560]